MHKPKLMRYKVTKSGLPAIKAVIQHGEHAILLGEGGSVFPLNPLSAVAVRVEEERWTPAPTA